MNRRMSSRGVVLTTTFLLLAGGGSAACDTVNEDPNEDGIFYCTDADGVVVDEDLCDDADSNGGFFVAYMGSSLHTSGGHTGPYKTGQRLPAGHQKFSSNDKAARSRFGLPPSGKISNGTVKTGVVGKGAAGSTLSKPGGVGGKAGSGGGAKGGSGG
jgi:hypothetical protein